MIIASSSKSPWFRISGSDHLKKIFESESSSGSKMDNVQETMDRQEQIIQELNEKIAVLEATVTRAPPRLVGVPIADQ